MADNLGLGIEIDADAVVTDADGFPTSGLYALGGLLRPSLYESTGVPELRIQVKQLAEQLVQTPEHELAI